MLNIVLFGPPGAGKGTQSAKLLEHYSLNHISTGDILRAEMKNETELGIQAKDIINRGELVPDSVVIGMIESFIDSKKDSKGFIFDGFPRTVPQAEALDQLLKDRNTSVSTMLALSVPDEELRVRLKERAKVSGRVDDQDDEKINKRIEVYKNETLPVAEFYKSQDKFSEINGVGSIDDIFQQLTSQVNQVV